MYEFNYLSETFLDFEQSLGQTYLTGVMNEDIFDNYPENIPADIRSKWNNELDMIVKVAENNSGETVVNSKFRYILPLVKIHKAQKEFDKAENIDFKRLHLNQEFITYFTFIEALFQDFLRITYKNRPDLISEDKSVEWQKILELKKFDDIHGFLIEEQLEQSGYNKVSDLIVKLNKPPFLFKIRLKQHVVDKLHELILIRNFIVHNKGEVSNDYITFKSDSKYELGDNFQLNRKLLYKTNNLLSFVSFMTFSALATKLFNKEHSQLCDEYGFVNDYNIEFKEFHT